MPVRETMRGFVRVVLALILTIFATLWLINHKVKTRPKNDVRTATGTISVARPNASVATDTTGVAPNSITPSIKPGPLQNDSRNTGAKSAYRSDEHHASEIINGTIHSVPTDQSRELIHDAHPVGWESDALENNAHARSMSDLYRCIDALENAEIPEMEQAIRDLWAVAADLDMPDEALEALETFILDHYETRLIELAEFAMDDLLRSAERRESVRILDDMAARNDGDDYADDPDRDRLVALSTAPVFPFAQIRDPSEDVQARMEELSDQALGGAEASSRRDAVQALSNIRNEATIDILLQAADDPDPENRLLAVQTLWLSAADGLDIDGNIRHVLLQSQADIDMQVAELAAMALVDLERLEERSAAAGENMLFDQEDFPDDHPIEEFDGGMAPIPLEGPGQP